MSDSGQTIRFGISNFFWEFEKRMKKFLSKAFLLLGVAHSHVYAQACCSAGTPLLSSLEISATPSGSWQFALTYENNTLRDVVSGTQQLNDATRQRVTHAALLEVSYGLSESFSATALLTLVQHERRVSSPPSVVQGDFIRTRGIGDAVFLVKYNILPLNIVSQRELAIGMGAKLPFGKSRLTSNGILLPADIQPGTGAWDGIVWGYAYQGFLPRVPINLFATSSYRFTGTNDRYVTTGQRGYRFGNEFIATIGTSYRTETPIDISVLLRYRLVGADRFSGSEVPNTGGRWVYIVPGLNVNISRPISIRLSGQVPLYRDLQGTQLTTSYTVSLSIFYSLLDSRFSFTE